MGPESCTAPASQQSPAHQGGPLPRASRVARPLHVACVRAQGIHALTLHYAAWLTQVAQGCRCEASPKVSHIL